MHLPLPPLLFPECQQPRQSRVRGAVGRVDEDRHPVGQIETTPDDEADARGSRGFERAHDTGQRIAVDDPDRLDAEFLGRGEKLVGAARATEEAEMRGHLKLGVAHHAKIPWMNHLWEPVAMSTPSPER